MFKNIKTADDLLNDQREAQRQSLKRERNERCDAPINNVQVGTAVDRENIQGTITNWDALGLTTTIDWIMADNTVSAMTKADLESVVSQYTVRKLQLFSTYQQLLADLQVAADPATVVWPA